MRFYCVTPLQRYQSDLENGRINVSLNFLEKIALSFDSYLIPPKFSFMKEIEEEYDKQMEMEAENQD